MSDAMQAAPPVGAGTADGRGRVVFPATVMVAMGIGTLSLGIVFFASEVHGASPAQVGFLAATWSLHYILGCLLLRRLGERLPPQHSMVLAAALMAGSVLLVLWLERLSHVFLCYAAYGLGTALFWPPLMGWLSTGSEGERLNRTMGRFNLCWSSGSIAGPVLAGVLAREDARLPVAAGGLLYLAAGLYSAWAARGLPAPQRGSALPRGKGPSQAVETVDRSTRLRYPAWAGLFAAYLALGVTITVFPLAAQAHLGVGKPTVGGLLLVRALFTTLALGLLGRTTAWHFRAGQMGVGLLVFAVAMAALPLAGGPIAAGLVLGLVGALVAQCYANSLFHGVTGSPQRARRMATHEILLSAGLVAGGACGGVVYQAVGYGAVCAGVAGVLGAMAIAVFAFASRPAHDGL
jgi:DHA1 family multidrug resistance protein-like MFS transporter/DHA1 family quinolone resistance protein-like MFS transporter